MEGDRRHPPPTVSADVLFGSLPRAGPAVATIDYRHAREAPFPAQPHDVKAAIRHLRATTRGRSESTARGSACGASRPAATSPRDGADRRGSPLPRRNTGFRVE
ncbi:hypothetical protein ACIPC1_06340 [Streptomyces sp. NPDC087263]|uniref:hypothetical protein n=1 Tax=Streptomyces sp. NPDC087263 TaxID=3365773 RepID=UPI003818468B